MGPSGLGTAVLLLATGCTQVLGIGDFRLGDEGSAVDASQPADGSVGTTLVSINWDVGPGEERQLCARQTIEQDLSIGVFRADGEAGTLEVSLGVAVDGGPDGPFECSPLSFGRPVLFIGAPGQTLLLPDGVASQVRAGQQVILSVHVRNGTDQPAAGETHLNVAPPLVTPSTQAEVMFGGTTSINLPSSDTEQDVRGRCVPPEDFTIFAALPMMRRLGRRQALRHTDAIDQATDLYTTSFEADAPVTVVLSTPVMVAAGDTLETRCTYVNQTGDTVEFGTAFDAETCFVGLYRYPAGGGDPFSCVEAP